MKMDFEEAHNNLRAIRLLYRLLHDNTLSLQNSNSEHLVERARILLKGLLDVAVESVFETHLQIIASQAGISKPSSEQDKPVSLVQAKSIMAADNSQSTLEYPTCSNMTPQMDVQPQLKLPSNKEVPELLKFTISDNEGENSKTLLSHGEKGMQLNLVKATNLSDEKGILPNTESGQQEQKCNDMNTMYGVDEHAKELLPTFDAKTGKSNEDSNIPLLNASTKVESLDQKVDFSDDLVNAIKRIESRILALHVCSNLVQPTKNSAGQHTVNKVANLDSSVIQRKDVTARTQLTQGRSLLEGNRVKNQKTDKSSYKVENLISKNAFQEPFLAGNKSSSESQVQYQNHTSAESTQNMHIPKQNNTKLISGKDELRSRNRIRPSTQDVAIVDRVKSLNRLVSGDTGLGSHASEFIQGLRVPLNQNDHTKMTFMFAGHANMESLVRKNPVAWSDHQNHSKRSPESSCGKKLVGSKPPTIARREKPPPHQMVIRPTLLDQRSGEIKSLSHHHRDSSVLDRRTHGTDHTEPWKTRVQPHHQEHEESGSNTHYSSSWTSQQGSTKSSSGSDDYSLLGRTQGPLSRRLVDATYEGSSEDSSNSYPYNDDSSSCRVEGLKYGRTLSLKSRTYDHKRNPEKTIGSLRRLKNKLGLIFHHHHHHHHHHHLHDNDDNGSIHRNAGHKHSMWNHLQNVFHHKNKHGVLSKRKIDKTRRGAIAKNTHRNQVGQFHRLVEGLLTHIRHSKKPKPSKLRGVKGSRNTPNRHSQKKRRWWQILRRRRGVKLKDKGRVKMRFMSQKSSKN